MVLKWGWWGVCVFCPALALANYQSNDDLFKSLDESVKEEKKSVESKTVLKELWDNTNIQATWRAWGHEEKPSDSSGRTDTRNYFTDARVDLKTSYRFLDFNQVGFSGWVEGGTQRDTYQGTTYSLREADRHRRWVEFNELYWIGTFGPVDTTVGRKVIQQGLSTLYSPANRMSPVDLNDPMDPKYLGSWQITSDLTVGDSVFTAGLLPVPMPSKLPAESSRWATGVATGGSSYLYGGTTIPDDVLAALGYSSSEEAAQNTSYEIRDLHIQNVRGFARAKTTLLGWDLFLSAMHGFSAGPVVKKYQPPSGATQFKVMDVPVLDTMGGFSTTYGRFEFHGEGVYTHSYGSKDDSYVTYAGGSTVKEDEFVKKLYLQEVSFTLEYAGEKITNKQTHADFVTSSKDFRKIRNNVLWRLVLRYNDDLAFGYLGNWELGGNQGGFHIVGTRYKILKGLHANLSAELFRGKADNVYGSWKPNSRYILKMEYTF